MFKKIITIAFIAVAIGVTFYIGSEPVFAGFTDRLNVYCFYNSSNAVTLNTSVFGSRFILSKTGESFSVASGEIDPEEFIKKMDGKLIWTEKTEEGTGYYAFSEKIRYKKTVNGKTFNIHVFVGKEKTTVGTPMIYGSY